MWSIWRDVKLLTGCQFWISDFSKQTVVQQGACGHHAHACQRSYAWWWKPGLITLVYLLCYFKFQQWDVDNPRTTMPCSNRLFSISSYARFSQSDFPLFIEDDWAASEQFDSFSKDIERFSSHSLSLLVIQFLLPCLTGVFLHVRCIPHQNSQRCFWASVCVCACDITFPLFSEFG